MAESAVPITPQQQTVPGPPVYVRSFLVIDPVTGLTEQAQGLVLLDEQNRSVTPMTESTGRAILAALNQLIALQANATGGLLPSSTDPFA